MTLRPVLIALPADDLGRGPELVARQRDYARRALTICADRCGLPRWDWIKDGSGVPMPVNGYHWSISHKPQWAGGVIFPAPVGIDIEHIRPRREDLFDQIADADEWAAMGDRSWTTFFRVWTAKEATLKANRVGIAKLGSCRVQRVLDPRRMVTSFEDVPWTIEHYYFADHIAAVTIEDHSPEWITIPL